MQNRLIEELKALGLTDEQIEAVIARANMKSTLATMAQQFVQQLSRLNADSFDVVVNMWANIDGEGHITGYDAKVTVKVRHGQLGEIEVDEVMVINTVTGNTNNGSRDSNTMRCIELVERWASQFDIQLPEKWQQYASVYACRLAKKLMRQGKLTENDDIQWLKATYSGTWDNV